MTTTKDPAPQLTDAQYKAKYVGACHIAERLAREFGKVLEPVDVAGVLSGAAINALVNGLGKVTAIAYLRDLAGELERDVDPSTTVN